MAEELIDLIKRPARQELNASISPEGPPSFTPASGDW